MGFIMNKIIFFLMFAFSFPTLAKEVPLLTEQEFLSCFNTAKDLKSLINANKRSGQKVNAIIREANNMEDHLDDLEFNYNMSETTYQICVSNGWECSASYNTYYYNWQRYNNAIAKSERLYDKEDRMIREHNRKVAQEKRLRKKLKSCEKVKVQRSILRKHCDNNRSNYFCALWNY